METTIFDEKSSPNQAYKLVEIKDGRYVVKFKNLNVPIEMNEFLFSQLKDKKFQS